MFRSLLVGFILIGSVPAQTEPPTSHGPVPTPRQLAFHEREFYAFIHFNMNTFTGVEWGHGKETPDTFAPTALDCDQWCRLFVECGLSGVIITAKHHDGFCLWPSAFTAHDVASSKWRDGKGDVVRELADACKRHGLFLGIYISPWDRNNPIYGRDDAAYNDYFVGQMKELLGGYGRVDEVWWDGANGDRNNPAKHQEYDWPRFIETVRELQPEAVIFAPPYTPGDLRWMGNERGYAGATHWGTLTPGIEEEQVSLNQGQEGASAWIPSETDVSIRPGWYWSRESDDKVKSVAKLLDIYEHSIGHNSNLLLNFPVDRRGLVHENDAAALRGMTSVLKATYTIDLAEGSAAEASSVRGGGKRFAASCVTDNDAATYWATDDGVKQASLTLTFDSPQTFDRVLVQEHIELGQRIRAWRIEMPLEDGWRELARGTTIGHKRIAVFDAVTSSRLRLVIEDSRACPTIECVQVHCAPAQVEILPEDRVFLGSTKVSLRASLPDCSIFYTLDGTEPTPKSLRFHEPFAVVESCILRAVAMRGEAISPRQASLSLEAWDAGALLPSMQFFRAPDPGLHLDRYEGGWQTLDQMAGRKPVSTGLAEDISIALRSRDEHVALAFHGYINVPKDGIYEFSSTSDDGSRIYVHETRVVDNDGLHGMIRRSGRIGLKAGYHAIRVEWFNAGGGRGLSVTWQGPGIVSQAIPRDVLSRN